MYDHGRFAGSLVERGSCLVQDPSNDPHIHARCTRTTPYGTERARDTTDFSMPLSLPRERVEGHEMASEISMVQCYVVQLSALECLLVDFKAAPWMITCSKVLLWSTVDHYERTYLCILCHHSIPPLKASMTSATSSSSFDCAPFFSLFLTFPFSLLASSDAIARRLCVTRPSYPHGVAHMI